MEKNFNLHALIIKSVEKQIEENDPPVTRETYERLLGKGYDDYTIKEMIASVIAEEIYVMMKDDKSISEDNFAKRLSELE